MRRFRITQRRRAIRRDLDFLYRVARDPRVFDEHGSDLLNCFYFIASTSGNRDLRRRAAEMGAERARRWRRSCPASPPRTDAGALVDFVYGSLAADGLGVGDGEFERRLRAAAWRIPPCEFQWFDPASDPPLADVPE